ncbi:MAG: pre-peptidase C-terminal domain-containing protein, partial [Victivallaceae bacterium]
MNLRKLQLNGLELVDPGADYSGEQVIYLDFKGANNAAYDNEALNIHISGINVADSGLNQTSIHKVITELNTTYAGSGVSFTVAAPAVKEYSTIYVGGASFAFARSGNVSGISETIDVGNKIKNDAAFVFSDKVASTSQLTAVIAHEAGHLLGFKHENSSAEAVTVADFSANFASSAVAVKNVVFVTHGYELSKDFPSWVDDMGTAIQTRMETDLGVSSVGLYTLTAKVDSNDKITFSGPALTAENMVVEVDWSSLAGGTLVPITNTGEYSTSAVAKALSSYLHGNDSLLLNNDVNISLIGHSRGGSLIAALADDFYKDYSVTTDSATFLDPHPLSEDYGFDDSGVLSVSNITTSYNYYRNDGTGDAEDWNPPGGWKVAASGGTVLNVKLDDSFFKGGSEGGYGYWSASDQHSDVHLWYQGTVDTQGGFADEDASVSLEEAKRWYSTSALDTDLNKLGLSYSRNNLGYNLLVNPEIAVLGKAVVIADGNTSPATSDGTDFGNITVSGGTVTQEFTIKNAGGMALNLTGNPIISLSNTTDFTISKYPEATVNAGGSTTFNITFDPVSNGLKTGTITISSSDADEGVYDFAIHGMGLNPDAGNTPDTANEIAILDNWVGTGDAADVYKLNLTGNGMLTLGLSGLTDNADLSLLDSKGKVLKISAGKGTANEAITDFALYGGIYYIKVAPAKGVKSSTYNLTHEEKYFPKDTANNKWQSAQDISTPDNWAGFGDAADCYKLTMVRNGNLAIGLSGLSGNADLALLDAKGKTLKTSANKLNANESITVDLLAGTYYVNVVPLKGVNSAAYTLTHAENYFPDDIAANSWQAAKDISGIDSWVGFGDAADCYKLTMTRNGNLTIGLSGLSGNANLSLLDAKGKTLKTSANKLNADESIAVDLLAGTYYVNVVPVKGVNKAAYTLTHAENYYLDDSAGDTFALARQVTNSGAVNEWLGFGDKNDYYKFELKNATSATFNLNGLSSNVDLYLYDSKFKQLAMSRIAGNAAESIAKALAAGTYYVKATLAGKSNTEYNLNFNIDSSAFKSGSLQ